MATDSAEQLIDTIASLCPKCGKQVASEIVERDRQVYQRTACQDHGRVESLIFSDAGLYRRLDDWNRFLFGAEPAAADAETGMRSANSPTLAVIDITNRCNLRCPLCFAETNGHGGHYFLEPERIRGMLEALLRLPVPCRAVQFSGGEPTLHPEFPRILREARELGFTHLQVATNGSRFVNPEYAARCEEAGLHTLYLQFDGMSDDVYLKLRGERLLEKKIAAVENVAKTNMRVVLVPTIESSVNADQIGPIFRFALKHSRHITGISIQPAAHTGRVEVEDGAHAPFNLAAMARAFGEQTQLTRFPDDWFPLSAISTITRGVSRLRGEDLPSPACDAHCSLGTYFYIDEENRPVCINRFFDLERFLRLIGGARAQGNRGLFSARISQLQELHRLSGCFDTRSAPEGLTFERLLRGLDGWEDKSVGRCPGWFRRGFNGMFVAGMHFMDFRNYNLRRLRRCIVQYVTTGNEVIPFCAYNAGARLRTKEEAVRKEAALSGGAAAPCQAD